MKQNRHKYGYPMVSLKRGGKTVTLYVHRLLLETFVGPCPPGMECRHLDNDPTNIRLRNLAWGTKAENEADKVANGTTNRGQRNGMSKLTDDQVVEIRMRYAAGGITQLQLAKEYGVSDGRICDIVNGQSHTHLPMTASVVPPRAT